MTEAMHLVLIFEDDEGMQNILRILFEANGFRVIIAATAARGERDARLHRPDIVLVDLGLPDRFDVYYGMADDRIGVARLDVPECLPLGARVDCDHPRAVNDGAVDSLLG